MAKTIPDEMLRTAADWWVRLREPGAPDETIAQWLDWANADARHLETFERMNALSTQLGSLDALSREAMMRAFTHAATPRRPWLPLAMAASFAAVMFIGAFYFAWSRIAPSVDTRVYSSAVAQNRNVTLPDGTQVALGAASTLTMRFSRGQRRIELGNGEAFFQVVHDASRPFVVAAGDIAVHDIGTAFDVRRTGERITIAVTQGRVEIADLRAANAAGRAGVLDVTAGQRVSYDPAMSNMAIDKIDPAQALAWRDDRLAFIDEPLGVVIANLNRYSAQPLRMDDPGLAQLRYTGTIRTDALDSWLNALPQVFPLQVSKEGNQVILSGSAPHPPGARKD